MDEELEELEQEMFTQHVPDDLNTFTRIPLDGPSK